MTGATLPRSCNHSFVSGCRQCSPPAPLPEGEGNPVRLPDLDFQFQSTSSRSRTWLRIRSISRSTSWLVHSGSATMKLACRSLTTAPPMRVPFRPAFSISSPALAPRGFLNTQPAHWWPIGWAAFFDDPLFLHAPGQFAGIVFFQVEAGLRGSPGRRGCFRGSRRPGRRGRAGRTSPAAVTTVACAGPLAESPPWVPALPCRAPPRVPGMPMSVSRPARPAMDGRGHHPAQHGPPPAVIRRPAISILQKSGAESWTTSPGTPSSRTRMFEPWPSSRTSSPSSWQRRTRAINGRAFPARRSIRPGRPVGTRCASPAAQPAARTSRNRLMKDISRDWGLGIGDWKRELMPGCRWQQPELRVYLHPELEHARVRGTMLLRVSAGATRKNARQHGE